MEYLSQLKFESCVWVSLNLFLKVGPTAAAKITCSIFFKYLFIIKCEAFQSFFARLGREDSNTGSVLFDLKSHTLIGYCLAG